MSPRHTAEPIAHKKPWQVAWDLAGSPFRLILFDQNWLRHFGWTTLEDERFAAVWPYLDGRLLDVGAGFNRLVTRYGYGVGVDVFSWGGGALLVDVSSCLPFKSGSFDTITFLACLNHIPYRMEALQEARRLIKPSGRLIVTMINPIIGEVGHRIWWYSEDKLRGGMKPGETGGLWPRDVERLGAAAGFRLRIHKRFVYWMNHLFVFDVSE